jgi:hypothetical protein
VGLAGFRAAIPDDVAKAFTKTVHQLNIHRPVTILVPDIPLISMGVKRTGEGKAANIVLALEKHFDIECEPLGRNYWSREAGTDHQRAVI